MSNADNPFASPTAQSTHMASAQHPRGRNIAGDFRPANPHALVAMICVGLVVFVRLGLAALCAKGIQILRQVATDESVLPDALAIDQAIGVGDIANIVVWILSAVAFITWFYRANSNLRPLGNTRIEYGSGWTIGCWFIPIGNLIIPYQIMVGILKGSVVRGQGQPFPNPPPGIWLARGWWAMWLVMSFLGSSLMYAPTPNTPESAEATLRLCIVVYLAALPAGVMTILLIRHVTNSQEQRYRALQEELIVATPVADDTLTAWLSRSEEELPPETTAEVAEEAGDEAAEEPTIDDTPWKETRGDKHGRR